VLRNVDAIAKSNGCLLTCFVWVVQF